MIGGLKSRLFTTFIAVVLGSRLTAHAIESIAIDPNPTYTGLITTVTITGKPGDTCNTNLTLTTSTGGAVSSQQTGQKTTLPHTFDWIPAKAGTWSLTAAGQGGGCGTSKMISTVVSDPGMVTGVEVTPSTIVAGGQATVTVKGAGQCYKLDVLHADSAMESFQHKTFDFSTAPHTYAGSIAPGDYAVKAIPGTGCTGGTQSATLKVGNGNIAGITVLSNSSPVSEIGAGGTVSVRVEGTGSCRNLTLDVGAGGSPVVLQDKHLPYLHPIAQTYSKGTKTLTATSGPGCIGTGTSTLKVNAPKITGISLTGKSGTSAPSGISKFTVRGDGVCSFNINWNDGSPADAFASTSLSKLCIPHSFKAGPNKTNKEYNITVEPLPNSGCEGSATMKLTVVPASKASASIYPILDPCYVPRWAQVLDLNNAALKQKLDLLP
jgi:hypothetical protein